MFPELPDAAFVCAPNCTVVIEQQSLDFPKRLCILFTRTKNCELVRYFPT